MWAEDNNGKFPMEISRADGGTMESAARGDVFSTFQVLSNELFNPRILYCPCDTGHSVFQLRPDFFEYARHNFSGDLKNHVSYFVGLDANTKSVPKRFSPVTSNFAISDVPVKSGLLLLATNAPVSWTAARRESQGNIGVVDGSVAIASSSYLRQMLTQTGVATNRLALP